MIKPICVTVGMGVGPELTYRAVSELQLERPLVLLGSPSALSSFSAPLFPGFGAQLPPISLLTTHNSENEAAEVAAIRIAAEHCYAGEAVAMVTGPIHKAKLRAKGFEFNGHTDFLGSLFNVDPVMAFVGGRVRLALVTTHIPLQSVSMNLSIDRIVHVLQTSIVALQDDLGIGQPKIAVCGLNPHAGEDGLLGDEEIRIIAPACQIVREKIADAQIVGPISAETAFFNPNESPYDLIVAMYHDQGLVPLKAMDFGRTVNWSIGLPVLRLSVDHGTADSLVGTGQARPDSLFAALRFAEMMAKRRQSVD